MLSAEIWAVREGLSLAAHLGIQNITVELHAKVAIDLICKSSNENPILMSLISDCRTFGNGFAWIQVRHTYREGNYPAGELARRRRDKTITRTVFDKPPDEVVHLLLADVTGIGLPSELHGQ